MSPVSFPFPPPTSVLGIIGAILGYDKQEYHDLLGWESVKIAVKLMSPINVFRAALNLLNTKETDQYFRPKLHKNTHIQIPFEFLKNPKFKIYAAELPTQAYDNLKSILQAGKTVYTPTLGLAQCLADVSLVGEWNAEAIKEKKWEVDSVLALRENVTPFYDQGRHYHRFRVPSKMDGNRVVHQYQEVLVAEGDKPIKGTNGQELYRIGNETISFL